MLHFTAVVLHQEVDHVQVDSFCDVRVVVQSLAGARIPFVVLRGSCSRICEAGMVNLAFAGKICRFRVDRKLVRCSLFPRPLNLALFEAPCAMFLRKGSAQ
jgi:hypothetical protein